jgi:hypothetical protein
VPEDIICSIVNVSGQRISGITFIKYSHRQKIGKSKNLKNLWEQVNQKGITMLFKIIYGYICQRGMGTLVFLIILIVPLLPMGI